MPGIKAGWAACKANTLLAVLSPNFEVFKSSIGMADALQDVGELPQLHLPSLPRTISDHMVDGLCGTKSAS